MRCKIGCGCGKNRANRRVIAKVAPKKTTGVKMVARMSVSNLKKLEKIAKIKLTKKKLKFCKTCPHSKQTPKEHRQKVRICHKSSLSIQTILNKRSFKCPINNF